MVLLWYVEGWAVRATSGCGVALTCRPPRHRSTAAELAEALAPATRGVVAAFVRGAGRGLPVAGSIVRSQPDQHGALAFACPHCDAPIGAGWLARTDAFRRARHRYSRRGESDRPIDPPPAACPLPAESRFLLCEARPHWCYPAGDAWCGAPPASYRRPAHGRIEDAAAG